MIILKIGGSILTNKDSKTSEVDTASLNRIASEIKASMDVSPKQLVIVHGAGSFGHPPAKNIESARNLTSPFILKRDWAFVKFKMRSRS
jgi:isopentenyl phosphate kinase